MYTMTRVIAGASYVKRSAIVPTTPVTVKIIRDDPEPAAVPQVTADAVVHAVVPQMVLPNCVVLVNSELPKLNPSKVSEEAPVAARLRRAEKVATGALYVKLNERQPTTAATVTTAALCMPLPGCDTRQEISVVVTHVTDAVKVPPMERLVV